jgi:hypothetical protein
MLIGIIHPLSYAMLLVSCLVYAALLSCIGLFFSTFVRSTRRATLFSVLMVLAAGPSNLRYGLDNWIYGMVGYAGFEGQVGGERHSFRQGFFRFLPGEGVVPHTNVTRPTKLEFLRNTNNNSWGVGFSEEGILFGSTANGNPSVHLPIPNRYYEAVRGWSPSVLGGIAGNAPIEPITDKVRQVDYHGHFTEPGMLSTPRAPILSNTGTARLSSPSRPGIWWRRLRFSRMAAAFARATPGICWPAMMSGPRRSWPRWDRTAMCG